MTPSWDPYSVLGVASSARADEVKAAYRARARLLHPDFHRDAGGGAPKAAHDAFSQLCDAYQLALKNCETTRRTFGGVDAAAERPHIPTPRPAPEATRVAPVTSPAMATAGGTVDTGAGFDWRGALLLVGLAVLGWLFVTDWLPTFLQYSGG